MPNGKNINLMQQLIGKWSRQSIDEPELGRGSSADRKHETEEGESRHRKLGSGAWIDLQLVGQDGLHPEQVWGRTTRLRNRDQVTGVGNGDETWKKQGFKEMEYLLI